MENSNHKKMHGKQGKLDQKLNELETLVLSLADHAHTIEPAERREEFQKELSKLLRRLENNLKSLSEDGE